MSYGIGHRRGLVLALLWLWHRLVAIAPIPLLTQKLPYALGAALIRKKKDFKRIYSRRRFSEWNYPQEAEKDHSTINVAQELPHVVGGAKINK